jgi:hypothetical protein
MHHGQLVWLAGIDAFIVETPSAMDPIPVKRPKGGDRETHVKDGQTPAWYAPHRAIIALGLILTIVAVGGGTLGVVNSARAERAISIVSDRYLILQPPVREVRAAVASFQVLAEEAFVGSASDATLLTSAVADSNATDATYLRLQRLLAAPGNSSLAPHLHADMSAYVAARSNLGVYLAGEKPSPQTKQIAAVEQAADAKLDAALGSLQATITNRLIATADQAKAAANASRIDLLWCLVIGVAFAIAVTTWLARKALRVEQEWSRRDGVQLDLTHRTEFEARLQRALEMAKAEVPVFDLVAEALGVAPWSIVDLSLQCCTRCVPQPTRSGVFCTVCSGEHQR